MEEITEVFDNTQEINIYREGIKTVYSAKDRDFEAIMTAWSYVIENSRSMPAYGVSLNRETLKALKSGVWAEFVFGQRYDCGDLPFEKLLVQAGKSFYGFNLIRYTKEYGYDGRCFYLDLVNRNMDDFYDILVNL